MKGSLFSWPMAVPHFTNKNKLLRLEGWVGVADPGEVSGLVPFRVDELGILLL